MVHRASLVSFPQSGFYPPELLSISFFRTSSGSMVWMHVFLEHVLRGLKFNGLHATPLDGIGMGKIGTVSHPRCFLSSLRRDFFKDLFAIGALQSVAVLPGTARMFPAFLDELSAQGTSPELDVNAYNFWATFLDSDAEPVTLASGQTRGGGGSNADKETQPVFMHYGPEGSRMPQNWTAVSWFPQATYWSASTPRRSKSRKKTGGRFSGCKTRRFAWMFSENRNYSDAGSDGLYRCRGNAFWPRGKCRSNPTIKDRKKDTVDCSKYKRQLRCGVAENAEYSASIGRGSMGIKSRSAKKRFLIL